MVVLMVSSTTTATIRRHNCNDGDDHHHHNDDDHDDDDDEYIYSRASTSEMNRKGLRAGLLRALHAPKRLKASAATKK
jgi:hypothetical protein